MNIKPGEKFDITKLKNPPLECEVSYGWLWNEPITKEGIDEQLESFLKAGIKSVYCTMQKCWHRLIRSFP